MIKLNIQIILELILSCLLFFNVFVSKSISTTFALVVLLIFTGLFYLLHRYRKPVGRSKDDVFFVVFGLALVLLGTFYLIGFKTGFNVSYSSIFKNYITKDTWLKVFSVVIISELMRTIVVGIDDRYKVRYFIIQAIMIFSLILADISIATKTYDLTSFNQLYEFFALMVIQSISKNILLTYITKRYGAAPCITYRFIMDLYFYFLPVTPKINVFIQGVLLLVYPYFIYAMIRGFSEEIEIEPARKKKKEDGILTVLTAIVFAILVALVSREFEYCMIAIGSGSMTGTINKGDAIIYHTYDSKRDKLKKGDIIVFYKNDMTIVHRIEKIYSLDGVDAYQTKGDANDSEDNWIVYQKDVVGTVKMRILLIAWPSVMLNELF